MNNSSSKGGSPTTSKKTSQFAPQQNQQQYLASQGPSGNQANLQQNPQKRQDVLELRQRIQNILLTTDNNQLLQGMQQHYQTYQGQYQRLTPQPSTNPAQKLAAGEQFLANDDGTNQPRHIRPPSNNQMYSTTSAGASTNVLTFKPQQIQINPSIVDDPRQRSRVAQIQVAHTHVSSIGSGNGLASQEFNVAPSQQPNLQRLLSEERDNNATGQGNGQLSSRIKFGFQENLNRRGSNHGHGNGNGITGPSLKGVNSNLNKATIVTMMTSHQQTTTSDSSKFNSQLAKSSIWLLSSTAAIKSKKVQDIIQQRQKACQFCLQAASKLPNTGSPQYRTASPTPFTPNQSNLRQQHYYHEHLRGIVKESLDKKYLTSQDYYNSKIVSDIMYNENRHIVSVFKDYLIFDDFSEYLKRYYRDQEAYDRLPKVFEFYEKYSKVFPNYVALPGESKYMFKNIERKQKLIDEKHQQLVERQERLKADQEEAKQLGLALDSSVVQRMRHSKNIIFGSQFLNDLTELQPSLSAASEKDHSLHMLRQQSSKILDMLNTIQNQAPAYQPTSVMNQFMKQHTNGGVHASSGRHPTQGNAMTQQSYISNTNAGKDNLEFLINQLALFDNRNDSIMLMKQDSTTENLRQLGGGAQKSGNPHYHPHMIDDVFLTAHDLSMSSHGGMSSFLQDFDLREGGQDFNQRDNHQVQGSSGYGKDKLAMNYRTQNVKDIGALALIGAGIEDEESHSYGEKPFRQSSQTSLQDSKRASSKNLNNQGTGSRQSLQNQQQRERITPTTMANAGYKVQIQANVKNAQKGNTKNGGTGLGPSNQVLQMSNNIPQQLMNLGQPTIMNIQQNSHSKNQQWANMLLQSNNKKPDSVRKITGTNNNNINIKQPNGGQQQKQLLQMMSASGQSSNQALNSTNKTKQPTPKGRKNVVGNQPNANQNVMTLTGLGGTISPQAIMDSQSQQANSVAARQSMHSADLQQQQLLQMQMQFQTLQPQQLASAFHQSQSSSAQGIHSQQPQIVQHLSLSSLKSGGNANNQSGANNQAIYQNNQQQITMTVIPPNAATTGGRSSQVSLGSPLSQHSNIPTASGISQSGVNKSNKQATITKEMLQSMPPGSSLKQIATAAAKAKLGQQRQSIQGSSGNCQESTNSAKKSTKVPSTRGSAAGIHPSSNNNAQQQQFIQQKPQLQLPLQTQSNQQILPKSGPHAKLKTESFAGLNVNNNQSTPTSLGGGHINIPSAGQLGSAGNSQSSMRISPDFSIVPNQLLMLSGNTTVSVGSGSFKKITDVSKSFKQQQTNAQISSKLNPGAISQSIRDAVSKLLPPQPKGSQQHQMISASMQNPNPKLSMKQDYLSPPSPAATVPPQSLMMTNTTALFNKLMNNNSQQQQIGGTPQNQLRGQKQTAQTNMITQQQYAVAQNQHHHPNIQVTNGGGNQIEEDSNAQQLQAVYSTRVPQKKNFSSPDDLQLRIAARKNQHQQLAIATAQSTLQPLRKSANDFYEIGGIASQSISPQQQVGKKLLVVLKPRNGSPHSQQSNNANQARYRKIKLGSDGDRVGSSAEKDDYAGIQIYPHNIQPGGFYGGSLGGDDVEEEANEEDQEDQDEQEDEMDERNDVYTAKGGNNNQGVTQSVQLMRGAREQIKDHLAAQMIRPMASSATATQSANAYNFKMTPVGATGKRNPSMNSDKSHTSSVKSNYSSAHQYPYQRVLTSFSTTTKKKVKVANAGPETGHLHQTGSNNNNIGNGNKLYEKIRSGMQATLGVATTTAKQVASQHQYNTTGHSSGQTQSATAAVGKKKPSTIFTFNK